jgi:hypothetical protein
MNRSRTRAEPTLEATNPHNAMQGRSVRRCSSDSSTLTRASGLELVQRWPRGTVGSRRAVRGCDGGCRGRGGRPVLPRPLLGAAGGQRRHCPGVRGVLLQVPASPIGEAGRGTTTSRVGTLAQTSCRRLSEGALMAHARPGRTRSTAIPPLTAAAHLDHPVQLRRDHLVKGILLRLRPRPRRPERDPRRKPLLIGVFTADSIRVVLPRHSTHDVVSRH